MIFAFVVVYSFMYVYACERVRVYVYVCACQRVCVCVCVSARTSLSDLHICVHGCLCWYNMLQCGISVSLYPSNVKILLTDASSIGNLERADLFPIAASRDLV